MRTVQPQIVRAEVESRPEWTDEFVELGPDDVRAALVTTRWPREKRDAARVWVEQQDAAAWQEARGEGEDGRSSLILWLRGLPWWSVVGPGITIIGAARMLARLRYF